MITLLTIYIYIYGCYKENFFGVGLDVTILVSRKRKRGSCVEKWERVPEKGWKNEEISR